MVIITKQLFLFSLEHFKKNRKPLFFVFLWFIEMTEWRLAHCLRSHIIPRVSRAHLWAQKILFLNYEIPQDCNRIYESERYSEQQQVFCCCLYCDHGKHNRLKFLFTNGILQRLFKVTAQCFFVFRCIHGWNIWKSFLTLVLLTATRKWNSEVNYQRQNLTRWPLAPNY